MQARGLSRRYGEEGAAVDALDGVDFELGASDYLAITGRSGSGKSTLLHILAALDQPTGGAIAVDGHDLTSLDEGEADRYRRDVVGVVFQFFNLMPTLDVVENIALPLRLAGHTARAAAERAEELLPEVGLEERGHHLVHQLSGGEMQRAAVARALAGKPKLLLADEPTGNLDSENAGRVLEIFDGIHRRGESAIIMVTHSEAAAGRAASRRRMADGRFVA